MILTEVIAGQIIDEGNTIITDSRVSIMNPSVDGIFMLSLSDEKGNQKVRKIFVAPQLINQKQIFYVE